MKAPLQEGPQGIKWQRIHDVNPKTFKKTYFLQIFHSSFHYKIGFPVLPQWVLYVCFPRSPGTAMTQFLRPGFCTLERDHETQRPFFFNQDVSEQEEACISLQNIQA